MYPAKNSVRATYERMLRDGSAPETAGVPRETRPRNLAREADHDSNYRLED